MYVSMSFPSLYVADQCSLLLRRCATVKSMTPEEQADYNLCNKVVQAAYHQKYAHSFL